MKTATIMKRQNLRYFSSLTPYQKDRMFKTILNHKLGTVSLTPGLQEAIRNSLDIETLLNYKTNFDKLIKGQKCFYHEGELYPLNIKEILNNI